MPYLDHLPTISKNLINNLMDKDKTYGSSWKKRGGVGAYMMLARKWDRIEIQAQAQGYDILTMMEKDYEVADGIVDDVNDLVSYLLLCLAEVTHRQGKQYELVSPIETKPSLHPKPPPVGMPTPLPDRPWTITCEGDMTKRVATSGEAMDIGQQWYDEGVTDIKIWHNHTLQKVEFHD